MNRRPLPKLFVFLAFLQSIFLSAHGQEQHTPKLVVCGGGAMPETVFKEFRNMAGKEPKLVVIPTASTRKVDPEAVSKLWSSRGFDDVKILHTMDRKIASSDAFIKPLREATAVWFGGGSQQRIADAYLDTSVEEELYRILKRGGVIGGTSAGGAIQSKIMIAGGKSTPKISRGFDFVKNGIIDQHFLKRNRINRLIAAVRKYPNQTGFGIDEGTALVIRDGKRKVIGQSYLLQIKSIQGEISVESFNNGEFLPDSKK